MKLEKVYSCPSMPWNSKNYRYSSPETVAGLVSIVIPTYNRLKFLEARINELLLQTYKDIEIIVVDDYSNDGTNDYLQLKRGEDSRIKIISCQSNSNNVSIPRNIGISYAKGEFITFADDDVIQFSDKVEVLLNNLNDNNIVVGQRRGHYSFSWPGNIDTSQFLFRKKLYDNYPYVLTTHADDFALLNTFRVEPYKIINNTVCEYLWHENNRTYKASRKTDPVHYHLLLDGMNIMNDVVLITEH
jgi:glycosyltransferase involved in cell wall biosynthesis